MSLAVYELDIVKVKREAIELIRGVIKEGYFKLPENKRREKLLEINIKMSNIYEVDVPKVRIDERLSNSYTPSVKVINCANTSLISWLHEYRHHLQNVKGLKYEGLTTEQDARAWSLKIYSKAVPKMFEKAVKEGRVVHIKWDNTLNKVVDNARYI